MLAELLAHCDLDAGAVFLAEAAACFRKPAYYRPQFSSGELSIIAEETAMTARRFGYYANADGTLRHSAQ